MLAQVYLIEPEIAADTAQTASRNTTYLTIRERQALADKHGVGDLYRRFRDQASGRLFTNSMGPGSVALIVRIATGTRTILVMHLGESDQASGLKCRVNATRVMKYFGLNEEQVRACLPGTFQPMPASEWRSASMDKAEDWKGFKGCFRSVGEIETFMATLCPQPQRDDE